MDWGGPGLRRTYASSREIKVFSLVIPPTALGGSPAATFPYPEDNNCASVRCLWQGILRSGVAKRKVSGSET